MERFEAAQVKDNTLDLLLNTPSLVAYLEKTNTKFIEEVRDKYKEWKIEKLHQSGEYTPSTSAELVQQLKDLKIRILLADTTSLQKINPLMDGKPVMGEAIIMFADEPKSYIKSGMAICTRGNCDGSFGIKLDEDYKITYPLLCPNCSVGKLEIDESSLKFDWMQYIFLEEFPENAKKNNPAKFTARIVGDLVGNALIGQRKKFVGIPKTIVEDIKEEFHGFILDIISFTDMDDEKPPEIDMDEMLKIQHRSEQDEKYLDWLCDSFVPHIKHRNLEKLAILLSITSGSTGMDLRSRSHLFLVGDPGSAKSELGKGTKKIITKGDIVDGTAVSQAGLVFGLDKMSNGQQIPKAGAAVLNNGGVLIIDEFDKAKSERKSLHSVLEQGVAIYSKIQKIKAPAVITMIALANPKYTRWKDNMNVIDNLEHIESTLLDRCDTIVRMLPIKDIDKTRKQLESFIDGVNLTELDPNLLSTPQLKSFIFYIRKLNPKITDEAKKKILDFYADMQKLEQPEGSLPMEQRQGEGLVRLCISMARLFFKEEVDCNIVDRVITFYKQTLETLGMKTDDGIHQMPMEKYQLNREEAFWMAVKETEKNEDGYWEASDVIKRMMSSPHFKDDGSAEEYVYTVMWDKTHRITQKGGKFKKI